jgi:hypothetical protein
MRGTTLTTTLTTTKMRGAHLQDWSQAPPSSTGQTVYCDGSNSIIGAVTGCLLSVTCISRQRRPRPARRSVSSVRASADVRNMNRAQLSSARHDATSSVLPIIRVSKLSDRHNAAIIYPSSVARAGRHIVHAPWWLWNPAADGLYACI